MGDRCLSLGLPALLFDTILLLHTLPQCYPSHILELPTPLFLDGRTLVFFVCFFISDCAKTDVVFVQNATTGTNSVIQSLVKTLQPGDEVLMTSFTYGKGLHTEIIIRW